MSATPTEQHQISISDAWPGVVDWLESHMPSDFSRRAGFLHGVRVEEFVADGTLVIRAELPGMDPEKDIEITVDGDMLTIEGRRQSEREDAHRSEFYYGKFSRTLSLPHGTDAETITASYDSGILEIRLPIDDASTSARRIEITHP